MHCRFGFLEPGGDVRVIAYFDELPVLGIEVETPVITAFIDEDMDDEDFIDTWKFAVIEE